MVGYLDAKGTETEKDFDLGIESKSNATDFCTKVDVENERKISNGIKLHFPTHNIIGEEEVGTGSIPALHPSTPTWIIDPIDGTTNFNAGLSSLTCVSIGFCHPTDIRRHSGGNELRNRPVMGVGKFEHVLCCMCRNFSIFVRQHNHEVFGLASIRVLYATQ